MPFENVLDIEVKAFFFNAETDYLPYYKNFSFNLPKETELKEVLKLIKEKNPNFSYPEKNLLFRVNDLMVTGDEKVSDIVEQLGSELKISPALEFRSDNGLIINNHDFMHQYRTIFERHNTSKEDLAYYLTLYPIHYSSETFNYNREYIGDAILLLAHKMIADGSEYKEEILEAINDEFNGIRCCEYENNIFNGENHNEKINELKAMLNLKEKISFSDKISALTLRKHNHDIEKPIEGQNVALYVGDKDSAETIEMFNAKAKEAKANVINFEMSMKKAGQSIIGSYKQLAEQKAGTVFLNALDNGADILVCSKDSDIDFFQSVISSCEREVGREIELKIISMNSFHKLLEKTEA